MEIGSRMTPVPSSQYLQTLRLYYEEEIEGEAYFAELANVFDHPDQTEKLRLLARVERHAAKAVVPLLNRHGLTLRASHHLLASGKAEARQTSKDWGRLIAEMTASYPAYLDAFRSLEAMGPPEDLPLLSFLSQHEVAAIEFLELENRQSPDSAAPLRDYLNTPPETWVPV
ncbi:MAG: hypothetical protein AAGK26_13545 [Pseudomonadota bacterium]